MSNRLQDMEKFTVILASASPRRTELLHQAGIEHIVMPSGCEEVVKSSVPCEVVMDLSRQKAEDVYARYWKETGQEKGNDFLVIGSDTVVAAEEKILGKPENEEEAYGMISLLQGNVHQVYTGVTILTYRDGAKSCNTFYECSNVQVYPMDEEEIRGYIAGGEPMDKAGAYGIQGSFAVFIQGIEGDYNNIVGLPIARIYQELKK